uniref:Uncharacterized protein n=1 Tax=Sphaerodactylus townsendi TaxID=933632 RepID=A0ACB8F9P0_9SAUR
MASRKTYLLKHIIALHRDHLYAKDNMDTGSSEKKMETSAGLKLILKRYRTGASRKALWRRKRISSGSCGIEDAQIVGDANNVDSKSEEISPSAKDMQLNEDHMFLSEKHIHSGTKSPTALQYSRAEDGLCSGRGLLKKAVRGPTVMMVKNNKISVPANYSAKFMGFKMVDGKQHIVIKLLPKPKLPAVDKIDGVKDISAECLQRDNHSLLSGAGPHEGYQGSKADSLESRKQQEIGQEQPVYALLPNGRQAVFLKCMSPNKSLVQNHNVFQGIVVSKCLKDVKQFTVYPLVRIGSGFLTVSF